LGHFRARRNHWPAQSSLSPAACAQNHVPLSACIFGLDFLETQMTISVAHLQPIVALIAGILILIMPRLLNFIVAIYLIFIGIVGLGIIK
jgi:hypothetical protein